MCHLFRDYNGFDASYLPCLFLENEYFTNINFTSSPYPHFFKNVKMKPIYQEPDRLSPPKSYLPPWWISGSILPRNSNLTRNPHLGCLGQKMDRVGKKSERDRQVLTLRVNSDFWAYREGMDGRI